MKEKVNTLQKRMQGESGYKSNDDFKTTFDEGWGKGKEQKEVNNDTERTDKK